MSTTKPRHLLRLEYEKAAEAYLRSLPPEHFMEATAQATQRKITLESLDLVHARRPAVQIFNELLVQYPGPRDKIRQVVPDNMVVLWEEPIKATGSYDIPLQPVLPLWVLEYVSKYSLRKDYEDSFQKYERDLKIPYFLLFYPDAQELTLYRHTGKKYASVRANPAGRHPIPELDLELAIHDEWVRFWFEGKLLPLPADLQREVDELRRELKQSRQQAKQAQEQAKQAQERAQQAEAREASLLAQLKKLGITPEN
jgi:Uma2 family endonuclease